MGCRKRTCGMAGYGRGKSVGGNPNPLAERRPQAKIPCKNRLELWTTNKNLSMSMQLDRKMTRIRKLSPVWRIAVEVGFIVFLYYSNLLMGQYTGSGLGLTKGLWWAIQNSVTPANFVIALVTAFIGQMVIEYFRKRI